jgi:hypothetical protein
LTIANTNSANDFFENHGLKSEGHTDITFAKVPGAQKVDTNDEKDNNRDVDRQVVELTPND